MPKVLEVLVTVQRGTATLAALEFDLGCVLVGAELFDERALPTSVGNEVPAVAAQPDGR